MMFRVMISVLTFLVPMFSFAGTPQNSDGNVRNDCQASSICAIEYDHLATQTSAPHFFQGHAMARPLFANRVFAKPDNFYLSQIEITDSSTVENGHNPRATTCDGIDIPLHRINSYEDIDRFIEAEIQASHKKNGAVGWDCLVRSFESFAESTSVVIYRNVEHRDGSITDVYRFTVDRRDGLWRYYWMVFSMPGGANGVYTAITTQSVDGQVAIINRRGKPIWLIFE